MEVQGQPTLAVLFATFLPYTIARLRRTQKRFAQLGWRVVGIESGEFKRKYSWRRRSAEEPFEWLTLTEEGRPLEKAGAGELRRRVRQVLERLCPSAIAVAGYNRPEMRAAAGWARKHKALSVLMSETKWDDRRRSWWKTWYQRRLVGRYDAALVSGGAAREHLVRLGMSRELVSTGYGAVDNDYLASVSRRIRGLSKTPLPLAPPSESGARGPGCRMDTTAHGSRAAGTFLACCRLIERRKNVLRLLRAFKRYRDRVPDEPWELVVCGDGPSRPLYEAVIRDEKIEGVHLPGHRDLQQLAREYALAECFVHPAVNEAWGLVVNEAMASGLPVLVSRRAGCASDLVHEGANGWTFNPYDVEELAERMLRVTRLPRETRCRMGRQSQQIIRRWSTDRFARGLLQALRAAQRARRLSGEQGLESLPLPLEVDWGEGPVVEKKVSASHFGGRLG